MSIEERELSARRRRKAVAGYRLFQAKQGRSESERLRLFEAAFDPITTEVLDSLPIQPAWTFLEIGSGHGSIARWMSERVSCAGSVTAIDMAPPIAEGSLGLRAIRRDITRAPLPEGAFDCVHARSVLHLLPTRDQVLERIASSLKSGGWFVDEELDISYACESGLGDFAEVWRALRDGAAVVGADLDWVKRMHGNLTNGGLTDVSVSVREFRITGNSPLAHLWSQTFEGARELIMGSGCSESSLNSVLAHLQQPAFESPGPALVTSVGRSARAGA
jgi:SAM-dependent methyltransferase